MTPPPGYCTKFGAAGMLGVHPRTVERLLARGVLTRHQTRANRKIVLIPLHEIERVATVEPTPIPGPRRNGVAAATAA